MYPGDESCVPGPITASCTGSLSTVTQQHYPPSPMYVCHTGPTVGTATCQSGCSITAALTYGDHFDFEQPPLAQQLCAEAVDAKVGDSCSSGCVPTRAVLAADGTVMSETYLTCSGSQCIAATAPTVASYLLACDATTLSQYGTTNVNGLVVQDSLNNPSACLLAWNSTTSAITSGITTKCIGDWQCPEGSLCDDQLPLLVSTSTPVAVCKPGPRGTLTPAMLSP